MRIAPLLPAEIAQLPAFIDKWTAIGQSTDPLDRDAMEAALARFYAFAGLAEPWVLWAPCPFSAALSAAVYAALIAGRPKREVRDRDDLDVVIHGVTRFGLVVPPNGLDYERMRATISRVVGRALQLRALAAGAPHEPPPLPIATVFAAATRAARYGRLHPALEESLKCRVAAPIERTFERGFPGLLRRALRQLIAGLDAPLRPAASARLGAPFDIGYAAQMDVANAVLGLPLDRSFIDLVEGGGLFWVFDGLCLAAERPTHIHRDKAGHLHAESGPSIAYRSGWAWWHWHGTQIEPDLVKRPERITLAAIERMPNANRRQILIERYRHGEAVHGLAAYLRDTGSLCLDHDPAFGTLWRQPSDNAAPVLLVEVVNRTPEPDGTSKHYLLRVDPQLRPMLADGSFGPPQPMTARNAVASTFGVTGAEYMPESET